MSKYLGKLLLESGSVNEKLLDVVMVKYIKSKNAFGFRYETENKIKAQCGGGGVFYVGAEFCRAFCSLRGYLECQYRWSTGYVVREKKGMEEFVSMRNAELEMLGGRKDLILSGQLDNDDDFDMLCAIQYLFKLSISVLDEVMKQVKRKKWGRDSSSWLELERRVLGHGGRKEGCKNKLCGMNGDSEKETLDEVLFRVAHNKKAAVEKGFFEWYLEACKEECKVLDMKLDKKKCREEFDQLRRECE